MGCAGVCRDHQPRFGYAGRKLPQLQLSCQHGAARQPGLAADVPGAWPLAGAPRENYAVAAVGKAPGYQGKALGRPEPAGKSGAHMDDSGGGERRGDGGNVQCAVPGVGIDSMPLHHSRPAQPLIHVLNPFRPVQPGAPVRHDGPGSCCLQEGCALRAFAVQVDGDVHPAPPYGKNIVQPAQGQQFVAANQLHGVGQPCGTCIQQTVVRKRPLDRVQGGHGNQEIPESEGAEDQKLRAGTAVFLVVMAHPPAFRLGAAERAARTSPQAVSKDSIPWKCRVACLGTAARGNYVRMGSSETPQLRAVLFDRDGTLVVDVPYNGDPGLVRAMPGAKGVLDSLRARGLAVGVLSNQSGVARGLLTAADVAGVNARVEELLGPFDVWEVCPHAESDGCACRKPAPGMVHSACRRLGISAFEAALIGDIGSDVRAAEAAGARGVLVPTPVTRPQEITEAKLVAQDLAGAVELLLEGS